MAKWARAGRVYIDYLRNRRGATAVAPYSTRARSGAPVSVPLSWDELPSILRSDEFSLLNVRERLAELPGDPWEGINTLRQSLTAKTKRAF
jgi:bifunctional non-homologous end joining protein LigD